MSMAVQSRVLVVDDRQENLHAMSRVLAEVDTILDLAQSGEKALQLMIKHQYALAILDVQMPIINGFELAEFMRHSVQTKAIPIIFVTAVSKASQYVRRGYQAGAIDYLAKPLDSAILIAKVENCIALYQEQQKLQQQLTNTYHILDGTNDGWWEWHLDSQQFYMSAHFKHQLGYDDLEIENNFSGLMQLTPRDSGMTWHLSSFKQALKEQAHYHETLAFMHKEGHDLWMVVRGVQVLDHDGVRKMVGTFINVTEQKNMEHSLRRSNTDLEHFAHTAAHDLRAPLRAITCLSHWIEEDKANHLSALSRDNFDLIKQRISRLQQLIAGILDYSRISKKDHSQNKIDVKQLLVDSIDSLSPPNNCQIHLPEVETIVALGNEVQLSQVFINLLGNAIKYNDKKNIIITIDAYEEPNFWRFLVTDNGPGIEQAHHQKVFELFEKLNPDKAIESTGVGLSLAKKIVESHGGTIGISTDYMSGCQFYFTWPKCDIDASHH